MNAVRWFLSLMLLALGVSSAQSHPVPRDAHDRTISVQFLTGADAKSITVRVTYRLEVDEFTVVHQDMEPYKDEVDPGLFAKSAQAYYDAYARKFAEIIANNLEVTLRGEPEAGARSGARRLPLNLVQHKETLREDQGPDAGKGLGHLRCTFVFETSFVPGPGTNTFHVREFNFPSDPQGKIFFAFASAVPLAIIEKNVPDPKLNELHFTKRSSDVDHELRNMTVVLGPAEKTESPPPAVEAHPPPAKRETHSGPEDDDFLQTFRDLRQSRTGLAIMLLIFAGLGAAHALTPGHGKTLVAAYLVGEHGTVWHAVTLGLVTTATHTGIVLLIAFCLFFLPETMTGQARQMIQMGLGLVLGLSIACLGFWLLLQRLSGRADHIHLDSSRASNRLSWWGIIVLGVNGGLIPCWDAVAILAATIGTSEFWLALPALLAFSAGLACVLVVIGVLVVQFRAFAGSRWGEGRIVHALPIVSALIVTAMGIYLSYASIHRS